MTWTAYVKIEFPLDDDARTFVHALGVAREDVAQFVNTAVSQRVDDMASAGSLDGWSDTSIPLWLVLE